MKDEIKEIIDNLIRFRNEDNKFQPEDILTIEDVWLLLDYITNLQEELETTKEKWDKDKQFSKCRTMEMLDYKSRNEKAMEYIKTHEYPSPYGFRKNNISKKDLLNILNGGDDNE